MGDQAEGRRIRVAGDVENGSIQKESRDGAVRPGAGQPEAHGGLHGFRPAAGHVPRRCAGDGGRQTRTGTAFSTPTRSRPSAPPSMKPSRDRCPAACPPTSTVRAAASSRRSHPLWKISDRSPYFWRSAFAVYATVASVVGRVQRKPFLIVSGERAVYALWALVTLGSGGAGQRPAHQRLPHGIRGRAFQPHASGCSTSGRHGGAGRKARCCSGRSCCPPTPRSSFSPIAGGTGT